MEDSENRYWRECSGYFSCCGRSKLRGHYEECPLHPVNEENENGPD